MQTWAKRGIQSAFVTGGLLMLGTGIASAQENVNPDAAPSAIDNAVVIPVDIGQNKMGMPSGPARDLPAVQQTVTTRAITDEAPAGPVEAANPLLRHNKIKGDVVVPVQMCGNVFAITGTAEVDAKCWQDIDYDRPTSANGTEQPLSANVADIGVLLPVQATGNAVSGLGTAKSRTEADQYISRTGDIDTSGEKGVGSGNVAGVHPVLPVQAANNAASGVGIAETSSSAVQDATSEGDANTSGKDGVLSGALIRSQVGAPTQVVNTANTVGGRAQSVDSYASSFGHSLGVNKTSGDGSTLSGTGAPVSAAPSTHVSGLATGAGGNAKSEAEREAEAGAVFADPAEPAHHEALTTSGTNSNNDTRADGDGNPAALAGNVLGSSTAGAVGAENNAVGGAGNAKSTSTASDANAAGGALRTSGQDSTGGGTIGAVNTALPTGVNGTAAAAGGNAVATGDAANAAKAGGGQYTNGNGSVAGGDTATSSSSGVTDTCGTGVAAVGKGDAACTKDSTAKSGDYQGSLGNDAVLAGNGAGVNNALPGGVGGAATSAIGSASGTAAGSKDAQAGGSNNSLDDNSAASSNVVESDNSLAPQLDSTSVNGAGKSHSVNTTDTLAKSGGPALSSGKKSAASGSIVHPQLAQPVQGNGTSANGGGISTADATKANKLIAGGPDTTTGEKGAASGTTAAGPVAGGTQVNGTSAGAGGISKSESASKLVSQAGGDVNSSGDGGALSGLTAAAPTNAVTEGQGHTVGGAGIAKGASDSKSVITSGGKTNTSGKDGSLSGVLVTPQSNVDPNTAGAAASAAGGKADSKATQDTLSKAGGKSTTSEGATKIDVPTEVVAEAQEIPVEVAGESESAVDSLSSYQTGGEPAAPSREGIELPTGVDSLMGATDVPNLDNVRAMRTKQAEERALAQDLPLSGTLPNLQGVRLPAQQRSMPSLPVTAPAMFSLPVVPLATERAATPALPQLPTGGPASLSGLHLNPTSGLNQGGVQERAMPALSGLDTFKVMSGML